MSMTMKEMAAAMNLSETTLRVYLSKNRNSPAERRVKEAAMAMGWVPNYRENAKGHRQALGLVENAMPNLQKKDFCTIQDIADAVGLHIQTVKRAYANTDKRNGELEAAIRMAGEKMGYVPGNAKPRTEKPVTFYWGGNYHSHADEIARMKQLRDAGFTNKEIARKIGRTYMTVLNNIGRQPAMMTQRSHSLAGTFRTQTTAARAAYLRNKPIADYNAKVEEHNAIKARLHALQAEILTEKPHVENVAKMTVESPQMHLLTLQPTALN